MNIIPQVQQANPPHHLEKQVNVPDERVQQISKPVFERFKETISRAWRAAVIGFHAAADKIGFVFFRALEWIHPSLGPKIENVFLRVTNIWQGIKEAWKQEEIQKEMELLRTKAQGYDVASEQTERLTLEVQRLTGERDQLAVANQVLQQAKQALEDQQRNQQEREQTVIQAREIAVLQNAQLKAQNRELFEQHKAASQGMEQAVAAKLRLEQQVKLLQSQVDALHKRSDLNDEISKPISRILKVCEHVRRPGIRTEMDDDLDQLLPNLVEQIQNAKGQIEVAKGVLPEFSSARTAVENLEAILPELISCIERFPQALQLHANWQQPINQLVHGV